MIRTTGRRRGRRARLGGVSLPELMVGLAAGSLVVAGALAMLAAPLRAAGTAEFDARAARDLQAVQRLLGRLVRQAVPGPAGEPAPRVADGGRSLAFHVVDHDGSRRAVDWRFADGQLAMRLDGGGWQAVTDARSLLLRDGRFEVTGIGAGPCAGARPQVRWSVDTRAAADAGSPWRRIEGIAQVRHAWPVGPGCRP